MLYQKTNNRAYLDFWNTLDRFCIDKKRLDFDGSLKRIVNSSIFVKKYGVKINHNVIIVGSNPSQSSWSLNAFEEGSKSRAVIDDWFQDGDNYHIMFMNVSDYKTKGNKPLTKAEIKTNLPRILNDYKNIIKYGEYRVIAVGKTAQMALDMAKIPHFKMWHPSGLCRLWNDKEAAKAKIKEMHTWLRS